MFLKGTDLNFQNLPDIGVLHLGNGLSLDGGASCGVVFAV
jgi:hypothetical protein